MSDEKEWKTPEYKLDYSAAYNTDQQRATYGNPQHERIWTSILNGDLNNYSRIATELHYNAEAKMTEGINVLYQQVFDLFQNIKYGPQDISKTVINTPGFKNLNLIAICLSAFAYDSSGILNSNNIKIVFEECETRGINSKDVIRYIRWWRSKIKSFNISF
jgi:hypothetical protein